MHEIGQTFQKFGTKLLSDETLKTTMTKPCGCDSCAHGQQYWAEGTHAVDTWSGHLEWTHGVSIREAGELMACVAVSAWQRLHLLLVCLLYLISKSNLTLLRAN